jgi:hypothetical protein
VVAVTALITFGAMRYLGRLTASQRKAIVYERRKARYVLFLSPCSH